MCDTILVTAICLFVLSEILIPLVYKKKKKSLLEDIDEQIKLGLLTPISPVAGYQASLKKANGEIICLKRSCDGYLYYTIITDEGSSPRHEISISRKDEEILERLRNVSVLSTD